MIDKNPPAVPFIVDIEHAASLTSFTPDKGRLKSVISFLTDEQCIAITCLSVAAKKSLKRLLADDFKLIAKKVYVIYPALERMSSIKPDYEYLSKETRRLKLLFVGNQAYLKGLEELLVAIKAINRDLGSEKLELHIISDDAQKLVGKYKAPNVYLYKPTFSRRAIVSKFFIPADVFIMPTKEDTFGMAILDSLSSGTAVITTAQFALPELVNDGEDGILLKLNAPILDRTIMPDKEGMKAITTSNKDKALAIEIENVLKEIINGKIDIKKMGAKGPKKFSDGQKFSIQNRNKQLLKLYKGAINQT
jgi:glycosyltransferase involved in cell wall biosynthesis